jgi:phage-related protein
MGNAPSKIFWMPCPAKWLKRWCGYLASWKTYFKKLTGTEDLWECKIQYSSNIYRIFCFFDSHAVVILTHGFEKKSMKIPRQEIERAESYRRDYLKRKGERV